MIDTQAIRNKILDLAIQGKLTKQLPEDGTAEAIVSKARKKTAKMDNIPFDIPASWIWTSIEEVSIAVGKKEDQIFSNEVKMTGKYPAISQGEQFIDGYTDEEKAIMDLPIIIFGDHTKNVKYVDFPFVICADGTKCLKIPQANPKYVYYWMMYASSQIEDRGYARHYSLLKKYPLPLPPFSEQKRIVEKIEQTFSILDTIDELQTKYADNLSALKSKLIDLAIQGKLTKQLPENGTAEELYQQIQEEKQELIKVGKIKKEKPLPKITEDEKPFDIPESWKWVRLENVTTILGGYAFKSDNYAKDGFRVIRISDFNENGLCNSKIVRHPFTNELSKFLIKKNDILLCMTGGTVGKSYLLNHLDEPMLLNQRVALIRTIVVSPKFINYYILSSLIQDIIAWRKKSTNDNISMDDIIKFPLPLPPLAEQKRIVEKLEEVLAVLD